MREFGIIYSRYWQWALENGVDDTSMILGAYLLSCEHGNSAGCFRCSIAYAADDLGYGIDRVTKAYQDLIDREFILYCEASRIVFLPKYLRWNPIQNKNHGKGVLKILSALPHSFSHIETLLKMLEKLGGKHISRDNLERLRDTLYDRVSKPYRNKETDTDKDNKDTSVSFCSERSDDPSEQQDVVFEIPLIEKDGNFKVRQQDIDEWAEVYPGIDVLMELKKYNMWTKDNPTKRKTAKGIRKSIGFWLDRAQNKSAPTQPQNKRDQLKAEQNAIEKQRLESLPDSDLKGLAQGGNLVASKILADRAEVLTWFNSPASVETL